MTEEDDKILLAQIQNRKMERKRQQLLKMHPHKIWEKEGVFYTYLPDKTRKKGRRQIKRKSLKDLQDEIIRSVELKDMSRVDAIFFEWLDRQLSNEAIGKSTYNRYKATFERHLVRCEWDKRDIRTITYDEWIDWIEDEVARTKLTAKGLSGLLLIIRPIIKRSKRKGLIDYNVSDIIDNIDRKPFRKKKPNASQVINQEDFSRLKEYLCENKSIQTLGILLMMLTGIRVGELVTLKFSDFITPTCAEISRTETCYKDDDGKYHYDVKDSPKTDAGCRKIFLPSEYSWVFNEMRSMVPFAEYICTDDNGNRMTAQNLRSKMYRICEKIGIEKKSPHKARKTFASIILDAGVDNSMVISIMGHTDISCTETHYHKDRKDDMEKQNMIDNILEFKIS